MAPRVPKATVEQLKAIYADAHAQLRRLSRERRSIVEAALKAKAEKRIEEIRKRIASV